MVATARFSVPLFLLLFAVNTHAEIIPSTGADGALLVTVNQTLVLPADGIFNFTTVTIDAPFAALTGVLSFTANAANTPVFIRATGDVIINGTISVSGSGHKLGTQVGGPGGAPGGDGGFGNTPASIGGGLAPGLLGAPTPGAGGGGGMATAGERAIRHLEGRDEGAGGSAVGFPDPLTGGSSGAGGNGIFIITTPFGGAFGGGAGGAIRIDTPGRIIVNGSISANGAWGGVAGAAGARAPGGGGSGGVIDLHAAELEFGPSSLLSAVGGPGGGISSIPTTDPNFTSGAEGGLGFVGLEGSLFSLPIVHGEVVTAAAVPTGPSWLLIPFLGLLGWFRLALQRRRLSVGP